MSARFSSPSPVSSKQEAGFTLVELSIVLVIIGLIIGGILVGQDLIKAAQVRAAIAQIDRYNSAVNTFRLKYNALPGDFTGATTQLGAAADTANNDTGPGDGNGLISDDTSATTIAAGDGEMVAFWHHLTLAGLIDGGGGDADITATSNVGTTFPESRFGNGGIGVFFAGALNYYEFGKANALTAFSSPFTAVDAQTLDKKMDDGTPNRGAVIARGGATVNANPVWSNTVGTATDCVDTGASALVATAYNTDVGAGAICNLRVKMSY